MYCTCTTVPFTAVLVSALCTLKNTSESSRARVSLTRRNLDPCKGFDAEEIENVKVNKYDRPQPYIYEPDRQQRAQESKIRRNIVHQREIHLCCEENLWRNK